MQSNRLRLIQDNPPISYIRQLKSSTLAINRSRPIEYSKNAEHRLMHSGGNDAIDVFGVFR